jgi:hypothetical protein
VKRRDHRVYIWKGLDDIYVKERKTLITMKVSKDLAIHDLHVVIGIVSFSYFLTGPLKSKPKPTQFLGFFFGQQRFAGILSATGLWQTQAA